MNNHLQKIIENIKLNKKISGKLLKKIDFDASYYEMYNTDIKLAICYMMANNLNTVPKCNNCNIEKVNFISINKGFRIYCLKCSRKKTSERNKKNNILLNKTKSIENFNKNKNLLKTASEYYVNNKLATINEVSAMFNCSYNSLRTYINKNNLTKKKNFLEHAKLKFQNKVDNRLYDKDFLLDCFNKKIPLQFIADDLNVSKNTVRLYALKHGIIFENFNQTEKEIINFIKKYDIDCEKTRKIIKPYEIDIYSKKYNFGIELNGEYWHSENKKDKFYHINKQILAEKNNIKLIQIYYHEWIYKKEIIQSMIKSIFNDNIKIYARKCILKKIEKKEARLFFEKNHLQGWINSKYTYGLYYNAELVAAISLGKSRYDKSYEYELLRFCNKLHYNVVGGFSKMIKNCIKILNIKSIVTYSHRRLFNGKCYEQCGFNKIKQTNPGYFWYNDKTKDIKSRYVTQKHKLNTELTENEFMKNLGYVKVYDCGQNVYVLKINNKEKTNGI